MTLINKISFKRISIIVLLLISNTAFSLQKDWKITSDSSALDIANQIYQWSGNAVFVSNELSISGDEIKEFKGAKGATRLIQVTGNPVKLVRQKMIAGQVTEITAKQINYQLDSKQINANQKVNLIQTNDKNGSFEVDGESLVMYSVPQKQLEVTGQPLQLNIIQPQQKPLKAQADKMHFNQQTQLFEISGDVLLSTENQNIKAQQINYNSLTRSLQIPKIANQRVEMTQTLEENNE